METTPARALVATGVAVLTLFAAGTGSALPGTAAPVRADRSTAARATAAMPFLTPVSTTGAKTLTTTVTSEVLAGKHHVRKHHAHKRKHHKKHHRRKVRSSAVSVASGRYSGAVDTSDLDAVNAAYSRDFASGLVIPTGFTGDESRCQAGDSSAASRAATLRGINFVRSLAGLAPVGFSAELNSRSQLTALMMSANGALSHSPPRSWRCYTGAGADNAGRSNLALSPSELTSAGLVRLYLTDPGGSNFAAGHRRWLLNPFATAMGSGSTRNANALTVIGPTSGSRPNPAWVGWPSAGYFPNTLEPGGRWSLSSASRGASFSNATVSVHHNGQQIRTVKNRVENGYGQPTLVWQIAPDEARTGTYRVQVNGVQVGGATYSTSYAVKMFSPTGG